MKVYFPLHTLAIFRPRDMARRNFEGVYTVTAASGLRPRFSPRTEQSAAQTIEREKECHAENRPDERAYV